MEMPPLMLPPHERKRGGFLRAFLAYAVVTHNDNARRTGRTLADGQVRAKAQRLHFLVVDDFNLYAERRELFLICAA